MLDGKQRFSDRVENYVKYRPGYPAEVLGFLIDELGLAADWTVADIGSGTGILSDLLLKSSCRVLGVEPNREMREAAEGLLAGQAGFRSVDGSAEDTTVETASVDLITAGQAFHWFDAEPTRIEFARILKPKGPVVLVWNERRVEAGTFSGAYDALLYERARDYAQVDHRNVDDARLAAFYGPSGFSKVQFANAQYFDWDGLYGRAMSSSYVPAQGHPKHAAFVEALRELFERYADDGHVVFEYDTLVYCGGLTA